MEYDSRVFTEIDQAATDLFTSNADKIKQNGHMKKIYRGEWEGGEALAGRENIKITVAPDARNAVIGARRLMTATEESWKIPDTQKSAETIRNAAEIEKFARLTWRAASAMRSQPLRVDIATSLLIYSQVQMQVIKTQDLVKNAEAILVNESDAVQRRYKEINLKRAVELSKRTSYIYDLWDPSLGASRYDELGMSYFVREYETTWGKLIDMYGASASEGMIKGNKNRYDKVTIRDFWDLVWHQVWIKGDSVPLMQEPHGLSFIPIVERSGEGTSIFSNVNEQLEPFLYTVWKSGWYDRLNLAQTIIASNAFMYAGTPPLVFTEGDMGGEPDFDFKHSPPFIRVPKGGALAPLNWTENSKGIEELMALGQNAVMDSTMYRQALGAPLGNSATYSYVALLNQSGRLPLTPYLKQAERAIAEAMKISLLWSRSDEGTYPAQYGDDYVMLAASMIPEDFDLECSLDIALPQDALGTSQIALNLNQVGHLSWEWIATNIMDIEDWEGMVKKWSKEQLYSAALVEKIKDMQFEKDMARQQKVAEMQAAMAPPAPPVEPPIAPPGITPMGPPGLPGGPTNGMTPGQGGGLGDAPAMPGGIPGTLEAGAAPVPPSPIKPTVNPLGIGM